MLVTQTALSALTLLTGWNPTGFRWNPGQLPIPYCITANGTRTQLTAAQQRTEIERGINAWRAGVGLTCTTYNAVRATGACSPVVDLGDRQPNIFFETSWTQGSDTLGVTHYTGFNNCGSAGGEQLQCTRDADIELNDATTSWDDVGSRATDVASIMTHEYGHFIGLGHCNENNTCRPGTGVMYAAYLGGRIRVPFQDDINGACSLYPGTPGGVGYPCTSASSCTSQICINSSYCSATCGTCPQGYACQPNPTNAAQMVCLRDDGTNKALCESCSFGIPNACANRGACLAGIPDRNAGRCATPCPNPSAVDGACPTNYTCVRISGGGAYCVPKSSDCTNLTNFTELDIGQTCGGGSPSCKAGLDCIGICSRNCSPPNQQGNCPAGFWCETFNFQSGAENYCAPPVGEGRNCDGIIACTTGPCLQTGTQATCYKDCTNNASACNNAQTCQVYTVSGRQVGICEPPGVPPRPDSGVRPDTGVRTDTGVTTRDTGVVVDRDGGVVVGDDSGAAPGEDATAPVPRPDAGGMSQPQGCACDEYYGCDPGCECDIECRCDCDKTYGCDPGCNQCDPECRNTERATSSCSATTEGPLGRRLGSGEIAGLAAGALFLFARARRRTRRLPPG